jgi:hypothetical protein
MEHGKVKMKNFHPNTKQHCNHKITSDGDTYSPVPQQWLALQGDVVLEDGKFRNDYLWDASVVETILRQIIALYRNYKMKRYTDRPKKFKNIDGNTD